MDNKLTKERQETQIHFNSFSFFPIPLLCRITKTDEGFKLKQFHNFGTLIGKTKIFGFNQKQGHFIQFY